MSIHLQLDLTELHQDLMSMCAHVEDMVHRSVAQLSSPDPLEVEKLSKDDVDIDDWDVRIENSCLKTLALYQPVAIDLRRITTVMKIAGELERVADLAVNIAERASGLLESPQVTIPDLLTDMADRAIRMLRQSIDAYVDLNSDLARQVCGEDNEVDNMNAELITLLIGYMHKSPDDIDALLHLFSAVRQVERVADHATNIAEDVVYLVEGRIIRHSKQPEHAE